LVGAEARVPDKKVELLTLAGQASTPELATASTSPVERPVSTLPGPTARFNLAWAERPRILMRWKKAPKARVNASRRHVGMPGG